MHFRFKALKTNTISTKQRHLKLVNQSAAAGPSTAPCHSVTPCHKHLSSLLSCLSVAAHPKSSCMPADPSLHKRLSHDCMRCGRRWHPTSCAVAPWSARLTACLWTRVQQFRHERCAQRHGSRALCVAAWKHGGVCCCMEARRCTVTSARHRGFGPYLLGQHNTCRCHPICHPLRLLFRSPIGSAAATR